jgi:hypothetical protein
MALVDVIVHVDSAFLFCSAAIVASIFQIGLIAGRISK